MTSLLPSKLLYREAMEQVHVYNSKILLDRRLRMPYIDSQTGLAQQDCHLWVSRVQRCSPIRHGQIYSYPSRRWRVKKRPDFIGSSRATEKSKEDEVVVLQEVDSVTGTGDDSTASTYTAQPSLPMSSSTTTPAVPTTTSSSATTSLASAATTYEYYDEETFDSEFDSDEEFGKRKRKKPKLVKGKKNAMALKYAEKICASTKEEMSMLSSEDKKRPYNCQICGKRYKNQQGLRYHYEHYNHDLEEPAPVVAPPPPQLVPEPPQSSISGQVSSDLPPPNHVAGAKREKGTPPSKYCDFCLGTAEVNKKNGTSEILISCADCGRSGHPSCLQFNEKLTEQVQKYKWQCIECKCCCLCGTSDNDEQLLFCDDCDRGYHMYCLKPPIAEPPEGSWQCQLCNARISGTDLSKAAVLPEHMDVAT